MNNYENFSQSFSNFEPIYIFDEDSKSVVDSGEFRDCQAEIDSHIDECSSLFLNDFLAEELNPSVGEFDDEVFDIIPGRPSILENFLRESEVYNDAARLLGIDASMYSFNELKIAVMDAIIKKSNNKEVIQNETKNVEEKVETPVPSDGE